MGVVQYKLGFAHGRNGVRSMAHRKGKRYDSEQANKSYHAGYLHGAKERREQDGKVALDYTNPLNNQLFE